MASDQEVLRYALVLAGPPAEAEGVLQECLALTRKGSANPDDAAFVRLSLERPLVGQRKYDEAGPELTAGYAPLAALADAPPPGLSLADLHEIRDRLRQAAEWQAALAVARGDAAGVARWRAAAGPEVGPPARWLDD